MEDTTPTISCDDCGDPVEVDKIYEGPDGECLCEACCYKDDEPDEDDDYFGYPADGEDDE